MPQTGAVNALLHGDLVDAVRHHLPFTMAVPFLVYLWARWALAGFGFHLPAVRLNRWTLISFGVFALLFTTVLRNLDRGPLAWFDIPNLAG